MFYYKLPWLLAFLSRRHKNKSTCFKLKRWFPVLMHACFMFRISVRHLLVSVPCTTVCKRYVLCTCDTAYCSRLGCPKPANWRNGVSHREWSNGYGGMASFSLGHLSGLLALVVSDIWNELYILCLIQSVILVPTQSRSLLLHFRNSQSCNLKNGIPGLDSWDHVSRILHSANTILRNLASKMNLICWLVKS